MTDVRRQNLMILDLLTNAQQAMQGSAESLENFTRSEIMRDSAANMEMQIRDVIMQQMSKLQDAFLGGDDEEGNGNSFKAAVTSMVMKLEDITWPQVPNSKCDGLEEPIVYRSI